MWIISLNPPVSLVRWVLLLLPSCHSVGNCSVAEIKQFASKHWVSCQVAQTVKCLSAMQETQVRSLGWEDPLEKEMAAHSSILAWKTPWTAEPGRLPSMGSQRVGHDWTLLLSVAKPSKSFMGHLINCGVSLVVQMVKCLSAMQETQVRSLGWEDPLEKEMAGHSSILAWKIPWTAEPGRLLSMGSQRVGHSWATSLHFTSSAAYIMYPLCLLFYRYNSYNYEDYK